MGHRAARDRHSAVLSIDSYCSAALSMDWYNIEQTGKGTALCSMHLYYTQTGGLQ